MDKKLLTPAQCTVRAFGSINAVARAIDANAGNVFRWVSRGLVPNKIQKKILETARAEGRDLTAEDIVCGREVKDAR